MSAFTSPFQDNQAVAAGAELLNEAAIKVQKIWPADSSQQVEFGLKKAYSALYLGGGIITLDALLTHYEQQRTTDRP